MKDTTTLSHNLTADDLFSGGDNAFAPEKLPMVMRNGEPGIVYIKPLSAADAIIFRRDMREVAAMVNAPTLDDGHAENERQTAIETFRHAATSRIISKGIVTENGDPMFTDEQAVRLPQLSVHVFTALTEILVRWMNSPTGEELVPVQITQTALSDGRRINVLTVSADDDDTDDIPVPAGPVPAHIAASADRPEGSGETTFSDSPTA